MKSAKIITFFVLIFFSIVVQAQCRDILKEQVNSPIPMWKCGNPPTIVPKEVDFQDIKAFHMAVSYFKAKHAAWMSCATEYIFVYPFAVDDWGKQLLKDNEVIIQ